MTTYHLIWNFTEPLRLLTFFYDVVGCFCNLYFLIKQNFMKYYIYISGFIAGFLLLGWLVALLLGISGHLIMLLSGSIVLLLVYLPLVIAKRRIHRERMKEIIQKYQEVRKSQEVREAVETNLQNTAQEIQEPDGKPGKGWTMNDSPFRERRSGVTWGGGNIHAANASRNSRRRRK